MNTCPCCGAVLTRATDPKKIGAALPLSRNERRLFDRLVRSFGEWVPSEQLHDALYWDDRDGGCLGTMGVRSAIKTLRRKMIASGLCIEAMSGPGEGERRLIWQPTDRVSPTINTSSRRSRLGMHNLVNEGLTVGVNNSRTN